MFALNLLINHLDRQTKDGHLKLLVKVIHVPVIVGNIVVTLEVLLFLPAVPWGAQGG